MNWEKIKCRLNIMHCWHKIDNTGRKIVFKSKCEKIGFTVMDNNGYAWYKVDNECCRCGKVFAEINTTYGDYFVKDMPTEKEYKSARNLRRHSLCTVSD